MRKYLGCVSYPFDEGNVGKMLSRVGLDETRSCARLVSRNLVTLRMSRWNPRKVSR